MTTCDETSSVNPTLIMTPTFLVTYMGVSQKQGESQPVSNMAARIENDIRLLRRTIDSVIRSKHADLKEALRGTMSKFADEMLAADLITDVVMKSKDFETIVTDFLAGLKFARDLSKLEQQWNTFINILENLGGPSKRAAQQLNDMVSKKSDHFKGKLKCVYVTLSLNVYCLL